MKIRIFLCVILLLCTDVFAAGGGELNKGMINPGFYEKPNWFKDSFLELPAELDEANGNNKQIILYFHQDGCPYCKKLLDDNFSSSNIVNKMNQHFELLEINMWGDKSVTLLSNEELSEKEFAKQMKVMFTPTLIILNQQGTSQFRMNGYYAPDKFLAALDYVLLTSKENTRSNIQSIGFNDYYLQHKARMGKKQLKAQSALHTEEFIYKGNDFATLINSSDKPVMLLFEQKNCSECDELHGDIFKRLPVYKKLREFTIAQIDINSEKTMMTPDGQSMPYKQWAERLKIQYTPSIFFYNNRGIRPVFRSEAYLKGFHIQALLDYISGMSYIEESEFQRFVQRRADKMREEGITVELWD